MADGIMEHDCDTEQAESDGTTMPDFEAEADEEIEKINAEAFDRINDELDAGLDELAEEAKAGTTDVYVSEKHRTKTDLYNRFTYHAPKGDQTDRYEEIRDAGLVLAELVVNHCPDSRERSLALTKIEEAVMWANASIGRNE